MNGNGNTQRYQNPTRQGNWSQIGRNLPGLHEQAEASLTLQVHGHCLRYLHTSEMQWMLGKDLTNSSLSLKASVLYTLRDSKYLFTGLYALLSYNSITSDNRDNGITIGATPCNAGIVLANVECGSLMPNNFYYNISRSIGSQKRWYARKWFEDTSKEEKNREESPHQYPYSLLKQSDLISFSCPKFKSFLLFRPIYNGQSALKE